MYYTILEQEVEYMEPQISISCCKKDKKRNCLCIILAILLTLFLFTIGLLIGAAIASTILANLAAIIVLAVILGILSALTAIYMLCSKIRNCC